MSERVSTRNELLLVAECPSSHIPANLYNCSARASVTCWRGGSKVKLQDKVGLLEEPVDEDH